MTEKEPANPNIINILNKWNFEFAPKNETKLFIIYAFVFFFRISTAG